jgi:hypothetical protein
MSIVALQPSKQMEMLYKYIWLCLFGPFGHTAKAENYQMTDAAYNDKNSNKPCPSGDPSFISATFVLQTILQIPCF